ncbi:Uu.00g138710.m01.CDS01 [Anthostomella pinea]|uniref:Uu.00g138710.m01.CDS01 n=1 Tax=Anthostomella pinea TaxID=933095 RepID=A0AAI8VJB7_9PEZI|nr:Uu.00g138710.m01.CDS01 [Anthostomella pinea]
MAPRAVHSIRHAEGYHNSEENENIPDPDLTPQGRSQCAHLSTIFPFFDRVDLVCASPIRRAVQTALVGMEPYLQSGGRRQAGHHAQRHRAPTEEYGSVVDFQRCQDTYVDYDSKEGRWAPDGNALEKRALELRRFLRDRDEQEVVVVSHGDFLHFVTGDLNEDGSQAKGWWKNAEFRSYRFYPVEHEDALLQETDESVKMRNASGPGETKGSGTNGSP